MSAKTDWAINGEKIEGGASFQIPKSAHYPPPPHPEKLFLVSKCQNVKRCIVGGFQCSTCLLNSVRAKPNDLRKCWSKLSQLTNHRVYQELVYRNEVLKTVLTGSTTPLLQLPLGFRGTFLDPLSSLSWRLEQAISIVKRLIRLESHSWWWSSMSNRLISRYQLEESKWVGRLTSSFQAMHACTHQQGPTSISLSSWK